MLSKFSINTCLCFERGMLYETLAAAQESYGEKRTLFGNETEKVELGVIRSQRLLRKRVDRQMLRNQVKVPVLKIATYQYLEVKVSN